MTAELGSVFKHELNENSFEILASLLGKRFSMFSGSAQIYSDYSECTEVSCPIQESFQNGFSMRRFVEIITDRHQFGVDDFFTFQIEIVENARGAKGKLAAAPSDKKHQYQWPDVQFNVPCSGILSKIEIFATTFPAEHADEQYQFDQFIKFHMLEGSCVTLSAESDLSPNPLQVRLRSTIDHTDESTRISVKLRKVIH